MKAEKQKDGTIKFVHEDPNEQIKFYQGTAPKKQAESDLKPTKLDEAKKRLAEINAEESAKE